MRLLRLACLALAPLAGCATFPELEASVRPGVRSASYPDLVPLEVLEAQIDEDRIGAGTQETLEARADRLRARAARLRRRNLDG